MTFTPGPWTYRVPPDPVPNIEYWVDAPEGVPVADVKTNAQPEANARLIAAAPALLDAAELAVNSISMDIYRMAAAGQPYGNLDQAEAAVAQLRAAIDMAKGA